MYKRAFFLFIFCLLMGCTKSSQKDSPPSVYVVSTIAVIDDLVGQIVGERIAHQVLIRGEIDPHSYEIVKGDYEKLMGAKVVFYNGLGLEHGASLRSLFKTHPYAVPVGEKVKQLAPEEILLLEGKIDPHIWLDMSLWEKTLGAILEAVCAIDPEGSAFFVQNAEILSKKLEQTHRVLQKRMQEIAASKRYLVTSHDAFTYFARAYLATPEEKNTHTWQERFVSPQGLAPEGQLSSADIQHVTSHLLKYDIHEIFPESNVSSGSLKKIIKVCDSKHFSVRLGPILYGDAMGQKGTEAGTYVGMMTYNVDILCEAWKP